MIPLPLFRYDKWQGSVSEWSSFRIACSFRNEGECPSFRKPYRFIAESLADLSAKSFRNESRTVIFKWGEWPSFWKAFRFILVYFLIGVFYTKEIDFKSDKDTKSKDEVTVDNSTITLGQLFDQSQDEYYVLVYDVNDDKSIIPSWLSIFESKNSNATIYKVDSKNKFNSEFLTNENGNKNATTYSDLKVKSPTLIKINNKSISEYIEGEDNIKEYFKNN